MTANIENRPKILIVEDEQIVALDLKQILTGLGYEVVALAHSGQKAIQLAEQFRPDLIFMDIQLKGSLDGITAADQVRVRWQIPIVFVTANANDETLTRAKAAGPYGYLVKPFRSKDLNATILVALNQHRLARELFDERTWLRIMLESLSDAVIATDAEGRVRYMNPTAESLTGWTHAEALGQAIEEIYPQTTLDNKPIGQCQLRKALTSALPIAKARFLLRTKQRHFVPIEDAAAPIVEQNQVRGAVTIFRDITERLRREQQEEEERDRLEEQVQATSATLGETRAELRALSGHLLTAQEEERRRIGRELHDDFGQRTAALAWRLEQLSPMTAAEGPAQKLLQSIRAEMAELSEGLRAVSHRLYPSVLTDVGLVAGLRQLAEVFQDSGAALKLSTPSSLPEVPLDISTTLYRITQEALRNIAKHCSNAPTHISLSDEEDELLLDIKDEGPGFDITSVRAQGGLGLVSMQERARLVGGSLLLRTAPGEGTQITVRVPVRLSRH